MPASVTQAAAVLLEALAAFDPALLSGADCASVAERLAVVEKACAGARARAALRAADCGAHRGLGYTQPADWLAKVAGSSVGEAKAALETAAAVDAVREVGKALATGALSLDQAAEIVRTEAEVPGSAGGLVDLAGKSSVQSLRAARGLRRLGRRRVRGPRARKVALLRWWEPLEKTSGLPPPEQGFGHRRDAPRVGRPPTFSPGGRPTRGAPRIVVGGGPRHRMREWVGAPTAAAGGTGWSGTTSTPWPTAGPRPTPTSGPAASPATPRRPSGTGGPGCSGGEGARSRPARRDHQATSIRAHTKGEAMCMICDGATVEDFRERVHAGIASSGFGMVGVEHGPGGYVYTIGLLDRVGHPELVAAHADLSVAASVVEQLAREVLDDVRLHGASETRVFGVPVGIRPVAEAQLRRGLVAAWHDYYEAQGRHELQPMVLQVVLPDGHNCFEHQTSQPRLDRAGASFFVSNRAMRRAAVRNRGHRRR